jgi:hypothetical protein
LLDSIDTSTVVGLRDRALISIMTFAFARIGATLHHPVDHGPDIDRSLVAPLLRRWNQWADQRPLLVRQVTRVA